MLFDRPRWTSRGSARRRPFRLEPLEPRVLLSVTGAEAMVAPFTIAIDYRYDTASFFDTETPEERTALERAASMIAARLGDDLAAITPVGDNHWTALFTNPFTGAGQQLTDLAIASNQLVVFVGGRDLADALGFGGPGGWSASGTTEWLTTVKTRGETGADAGVPTDFGPWGGSIVFDATASWHFGETTEGLDAGEFDFTSVALHELVHAIGFGTAPSWDRWVDEARGVFTGPASRAEHDAGGDVPLSEDRAHWADETQDEHRDTAMDPSIARGVRKLLTPLDLAGLADAGWQITPAILEVGSFIDHGSGFDVELTAGFDGAVLNLYDTETGGLGPADVTLTGATHGPVDGSLVMDPVRGTLSFVATGGPLEADAYTVRLRSAADGFRDRRGALLDGDRNGVAGGDYVTVFSVAPPAATFVTVPDVARGPGQSIDVPSDGTRLPIRLNDGTGVSSVAFTLTYDEAFLTVGNVVLGSSLPPGLHVPVGTTAGWRRIEITLPEPLGAGPAELVTLTASVSSAAPYGATGVLRLTDAQVNGATPIGADSGVLVAAYFGDATGNRRLSSLDAQRALRVAVGLDSGFLAYPVIDPVVLADITASGDVSSLDATRILQEAVGLDRPEIPPIPPPTAPLIGDVAVSAVFAPAAVPDLADAAIATTPSSRESPMPQEAIGVDTAPLVAIPATPPVSGDVAVSAARSDLAGDAPEAAAPSITWSVTTPAWTPALPVQPLRWQWRVLEPAVEPAAQTPVAEDADVEGETPLPPVDGPLLSA